MKRKMNPFFANANGGLLSSDGMSDVATASDKLDDSLVDKMGWADPFKPDDAMPEHVRQALIDAINDDSCAHYTTPIGSNELKIRLAKKLKEQNNLNVEPLRNILITGGSDTGLFMAIAPFICPNDEVIVPTPSYPNNNGDISIMGGIPVHVPLREEYGYQLEKETLEQAVTDRTKMVILTHPNNPTTTVFNRQSLEILRDFVIEHDLVLVVDQAFEDYTFEHEMITPASMDGMWERTVTVFSFSKGYGLSGLRIAYIVACDEIMDSMYANAVYIIGAANTACQKAAIAALDYPEFMEEMREKFDARRHMAYEILNSIPNVHMELPESGFLCWVDVSKLGTAHEISSYLIEEAHVSVNDGDFYGTGGEGHLRIVLGVFRDNKRVENALLRIKSALLKYQGL